MMPSQSGLGGYVMTAGFKSEEMKKQANAASDERRDEIIAVAQDILGNLEAGYMYERLKCRGF